MARKTNKHKILYIYKLDVCHWVHAWMPHICRREFRFLPHRFQLLCDSFAMRRPHTHTQSVSHTLLCVQNFSFSLLGIHKNLLLYRNMYENVVWVAKYAPSPRLQMLQLLWLTHTHTHAVASSMFGCICTSLVSPGWMGYGRRWRCVCALFSCLLMHIIPMWIGNEYGFICYYYCRRRRNVRRKWWKHTFSSIRMDEETVFLSFFYFIFCVLHLGITEARALAGVSDANEAFVATQTTKILRYSGEVTES